MSKKHKSGRHEAPAPAPAATATAPATPAGPTPAPTVAVNPPPRPDTGKIDDAVVFEILERARESGFDAYVAPQPDELPMANRREDILIVRP